MKFHTQTLNTPVGPFTLLVGEEGVYSAGFTANPEELRRRLAPRYRELELQTTGDLGKISTLVAAYFAGEPTAPLDEIPLVLEGTPYMRAAWQAMREIPLGQIVSYRELATRLGNPDASRAAGMACARNNIALLVPCHRILRSHGNLGGYLWGLDCKRWLLQHERVALAARTA